MDNPNRSAIEAATAIEVEAEVRYWEDATVDGVEDVDGTLIHGRQGDLWKAVVDLDRGRIQDWPQGVTARIHYKVCDAGLYWLLDGAGRRVAAWRGSYVPSSFLCHGSNGYGDYIIMTVDGFGAIQNYERPTIRADDWAYAAGQ